MVTSKEISYFNGNKWTNRTFQTDEKWHFTPRKTTRYGCRSVIVNICENLGKDPECANMLYETVQDWHESPHFAGPNLLFLEHFAPFLTPSHYGYKVEADEFVTESPMMYASETAAGEASVFGVLQLKQHELEQADFDNIAHELTTCCPECGCVDIEKDEDDGICTCWECDHEFPLLESEEEVSPEPCSIEIARVLSKAVACLDSRSYKAFGIMLESVCQYAQRKNVSLLSLNPIDDSLEALYARFGFKRVGLTCYGNLEICARRAREYLSKHNIDVHNGF